MAYLTAPDGTQLFYKDWGSGKPVVFIHGWPLNADMWDYQQVPILEAGYRTIAYDRRGFGRSDQPGGRYDYDVLADDLAALLDVLDLNDVTLVGFSMGGGEVARYVGRHGTKRIAKIVLLGAVTPYLLNTSNNPDGVDRSVFDGMVEGIRKDRPGFLADFAKPFYGTGFLHRTVSQPFLDWSQSMALQASHAATLACVRLFSETDFRLDLPKIDKPTLLIHGTDDAAVPIKVSSEKAVGLIPSGRLLEIDGASHGLFYTHRDRVNAELLSFLRD